MKIEFNTANDASSDRLCGSWFLAPLHVRTTSYRPQNNAQAAIVIFATSAKIGRKDWDKERLGDS